MCGSHTLQLYEVLIMGHEASVHFGRFAMIPFGMAGVNTNSQNRLAATEMPRGRLFRWPRRKPALRRLEAARGKGTCDGRYNFMIPWMSTRLINIILQLMELYTNSFF